MARFLPNLILANFLEVPNYKIRGNNMAILKKDLQANNDSVAALYPEIAAIWHPTKNKEITPEKTRANSTREIWFLCPSNPSHQWLCSVNVATAYSPRERGVGLGHHCPFCAPYMHTRKVEQQLNQVILGTGSINLNKSTIYGDKGETFCKT